MCNTEAAGMQVTPQEPFARSARSQTRLLLAVRHMQLVGDMIKTYPMQKWAGERTDHSFFEKIFNAVLGIHEGLPLFFEASTADLNCSRFLKFLSYTW